jgi:penicillin G amidase
MTERKRFRWTVVAAVACALGGAAVAAGLDGPSTIYYDAYKVPTIVASTEHDAIFLQGYLHAKNRFFQMDFQRKLFSGRVSELVGSSGLPQDIQLRTLGLRRAAERSLAIQTPEALAWLQAYADGVNTWLQDTTQPLPVEYGPLETNRAGIEPWTPLDSLTMAKGLAFGLSFDLTDTNRTLALLNYRGVCTVVGCNGLNLYNDDLWRVAPFESAVSIPSPPLFTDGSGPSTPETEELPSYLTDPSFQDLITSYRDQISEIPILSQALTKDSGETGSNWWVVAGSRTESGYPMLASDPHLSLGTPATFYENHLNVTGGINVTGVAFPGTPGVVIGCNDTICWGATVNSQDVTDVFNEVLVPHPLSPSTPIGIRFEGATELLVPIPQTFFVNVIGDLVPNTKVNANVPATQGGVTLTVPRRNNGPIVQTTFNASSPTPLTGLSVAYTGWSGTHEVETLRRFARASNMTEFKDALQYFDVGSQNWSYADVNGNIAYYTSAELPLRQDLQTLMFPAGLVHPGIIRDGTNTNKHQWLPLAGPPQPNQALSTQILPFSEMPQIENPPQGYILNANNDPIGTTLDNVSWNQFRQPFPNGLLYLSAGYASGERLGRLQRLFASILGGGGTLSLDESKAVQANNQILDPEILAPYLFEAYQNAIAPGAPPELQAIVADPRIGDAIARLSSWDFSTPTGIQQGFDPGDPPNPAALPPPTPAQINASVATTIYSTWRGQVVQRVIDSTLQTLPTLSNFPPGSDQAMSALRRFLDTYDTTGGVGASLVNFFRVPGVVDQFVARDIILLQSLKNGLDLLASNTFAAAYNNSTNLDDYRWGKLHRIVFTHFLGGPFNMPPPGHPLNVGPGLNGIARSGGRQSIDAASHDARANELNEFMFSSGPARRIQAVMSPGCPQVLEVIPGGENGAPGGANSTDQLFLWLVDAYKPLPVCLSEVEANAVETVQLFCGNGVRDPGEPCDDGNTNEADGCTSGCLLAPIVNCLSPTAPAGAQVCSAEISCAAVASCSDPAGGTATSTCDPEGPYGLGTTSVTVECSGPSGTTTTTCSATVIDVTPPVITNVTVDPAFLWPPNHRMVDVDVSVTAVDNCDESPTIVLVSATSSEPDDVNGAGDGHTTPDIDGAATGTADFEVQLRAERQGQGSGRTYTLTYSATDDSGNSASDSADAGVPLSLANSVEPINLTVSRSPSARIEWAEVPGAVHYDVIRGSLSALRVEGSNVNMGTVACVEVHSFDTSTAGFDDNEIPAPGQAFFYAVQFNDGRDDSSYGSIGVGRARVVSGGGCSQ